MSNPGPVWNGQTNSPNNLARAEGRNVPPDAHDWQAIVREMVATQQGLVTAGEAVKVLQARCAEMQDQVGNLPDAHDWQAIVGEMIAGQKALVTAGEAASAAISAFCGQLTQLQGQDWQPVITQLVTSQQGLTAANQVTASAVETLCRESVRRDALLVGFSSPAEAAYWLEQARRYRIVEARSMGIPADELYFLSDQEAENIAEPGNPWRMVACSRKEAELNTGLLRGSK